MHSSHLSKRVDNGITTNIRVATISRTPWNNNTGTISVLLHWNWGKSAGAVSLAIVIGDDVSTMALVPPSFVGPLHHSGQGPLRGFRRLHLRSEPSMFPEGFPAPTAEIPDKSDISIYVSSQNGQGGTRGQDAGNESCLKPDTRSRICENLWRSYKPTWM